MLSIELLQATEDVTSKNIHKIASTYFSVVENSRKTNPTSAEMQEEDGSPAPLRSSLHASTSSPLTSSSNYINLSAPSPPSAPPPVIPLSLSSLTLSSSVSMGSHSYSAPSLTMLHHENSSPASSSPIARAQTPPAAPSSLSSSETMATTSTPPLSKPKNTDAFGVLWEERVQNVKKVSPFGSHPNWNMCSVIVKYGDDLRQVIHIHSIILAYCLNTGTTRYSATHAVQARVDSCCATPLVEVL